MKQFSQLLFFLFIAVLLNSCNDAKEKRNKDFLTPLKIEIPKVRSLSLATESQREEFRSILLVFHQPEQSFLCLK